MLHFCSSLVGGTLSHSLFHWLLNLYLGWGLRFIMVLLSLGSLFLDGRSLSLGCLCRTILVSCVIQVRQLLLRLLQRCRSLPWLPGHVRRGHPRVHRWRHRRPTCHLRHHISRRRRDHARRSTAHRGSHTRRRRARSKHARWGRHHSRRRSHAHHWRERELHLAEHIWLFSV